MGKGKIDRILEDIVSRAGKAQIDDWKRQIAKERYARVSHNLSRTPGVTREMIMERLRAVVGHRPPYESPHNAMHIDFHREGARTLCILANSQILQKVHRLKDATLGEIVATLPNSLNKPELFATSFYDTIPYSDWFDELCKEDGRKLMEEMAVVALAAKLYDAYFRNVMLEV